MGTVVAVIPARYASTRLPGKPLAQIAGKTLIQRVWEGTTATGLFERTLVATDDERIADEVRRFGGEVAMTRADHPSGTDRVAEAVADSDAEIVLNVQGDVPFVDRALLAAPVEALQADPNRRMATASTAIRDESTWLDPNVVKVVTDRAGFALYFSRAPIPAGGEGRDRDSEDFGQQHIGLYAYRREFLLELAQMQATPLERAERLEQLRVLEHGERIFVRQVERTGSDSVVEVNTPEDLERAERVASAAG